MFKELAPLLEQRAVVVTMTCLKPGTIRVNVVPKKLAEGENEALTTPVSFAGTPEELDAQFPSAVAGYVEVNLEIQKAFDEAKDAMAAAAKLAKAEAKKGASKTDATKTDAKKGASLSTKAVEEKKPIEPRTPSLFDMALAGDPAPVAAVPEIAAPVKPADEVGSSQTSDEEIIAEIEADAADDDEDNNEDDDQEVVDKAA